MKKIYNAPYLKVVEVKNDIIATSNPGVNNEGTDEPALIQGRHGMWDDDFGSDDLY